MQQTPSFPRCYCDLLGDLHHLRFEYAEKSMVNSLQCTLLTAILPIKSCAITVACRVCLMSKALLLAGQQGAVYVDLAMYKQ